MLRSVENAGLPPVAPARGAPRAALRAEPPAQETATQEPAEGAAGETGEAETWAEVVAAWEDEARHRAYLARFTDLDGLAAAGRRYRDALLARPGDPIAARQRDEVLRRAVAQGLASLPRARRGARRSRAAAWATGVALLVALAVVTVLVLGLHPGAAP